MGRNLSPRHDICSKSNVRDKIIVDGAMARWRGSPSSTSEGCFFYQGNNYHRSLPLEQSHLRLDWSYNCLIVGNGAGVYQEILIRMPMSLKVVFYWRFTLGVFGLMVGSRIRYNKRNTHRTEHRSQRPRLKALNQKRDLVFRALTTSSQPLF